MSNNVIFHMQYKYPVSVHRSILHNYYGTNVRDSLIKFKYLLSFISHISINSLQNSTMSCSFNF